MPSKCSVQGCIAVAAHTHRFPTPNKNKKRFLAWLAACGNRALLDVASHRISNWRVCRIHFEAKYVLAKKLSGMAIPTLHLPENIDVTSYKFDDENENRTPTANHNLCATSKTIQYAMVKNKSTGAGTETAPVNRLPPFHQVKEEKKEVDDTMPISDLPLIQFSENKNLKDEY